MNLNSITKQIILLFVIVSLVSCDKDFNEIGTDIVGGDNNHYLGDKTTEYTVQATIKSLDQLLLIIYLLIH